MPVVIDASALAEVVLRSQRAASVEAMFEGQDLVAPDLVGAEVLSTIRSMLMRAFVDLDTARRAVGNLAGAPVRRMTTGPLVAEIWSMHQNLTSYDATYVALARLLGAPLLTLDQRLVRAPRLGVEVLTPGS